MINSKPFVIGRNKTDDPIKDVNSNIHQLWDWKNKTSKIVSFLETNYNKNITISTLITSIRDALKIDLTQTVTANVTLTKKDELVLVDATAGAIIVTLPEIKADVVGYHFHISKIDSSTNNVTITAIGTDTIKGDTSMIIQHQYSTAHIVAVDGKWIVS